MQLKDWRQSNNWTQTELAEKIGVTLSTVQRWEWGKTTPYPYHLRKLVVLGFSPDISQAEGDNMQLQPENERASTYFVQDRRHTEDLLRLVEQDQLLTAGMGGVLAEQDDPVRFQRVLDVGCGTGGWLLDTARAYPDIQQLFGIDISSGMVHYACEQAIVEQVSNRVEFRVMDALRMLEFPANYFDLLNLRVPGSWVRTWDWPKLLQEFKRVTLPKGIIRLVEGQIPAAPNSPAFDQLWSIGFQVGYQSGYYFEPSRGGITKFLGPLLQQYACTGKVSQCEYVIHIDQGYEYLDVFKKDMKLLLQFLPEFWKRFTRLREDYDEIYLQACQELDNPDFTADWVQTTVWGTR
jgi:ubiquinone/menaquinone biosynthesis C-methylase UbiE